MNHWQPSFAALPSGPRTPAVRLPGHRLRQWMERQADRTAECVDRDDGRYDADDLDIFAIGRARSDDAVEPSPRQSPRIADDAMNLLDHAVRQDSQAVMGAGCGLRRQRLPT